MSSFFDVLFIFIIIPADFQQSGYDREKAVIAVI